MYLLNITISCAISIQCELNILMLVLRKSLQKWQNTTSSEIYLGCKNMVWHFQSACWPGEAVDMEAGCKWSCMTCMTPHAREQRVESGGLRASWACCKALLLDAALSLQLDIEGLAVWLRSSKLCFQEMEPALLGSTGVQNPTAQLLAAQPPHFIKASL